MGTTIRRSLKPFKMSFMVNVIIPPTDKEHSFLFYKGTFNNQELNCFLLKVIIFSSSPSANYEDVKQLCLHIYLQSSSPLFSFLFMLCGFVLSLLNFEFYYALCPCIDTIFFSVRDERFCLSILQVLF